MIVQKRGARLFTFKPEGESLTGYFVADTKFACDVVAHPKEMAFTYQIGLHINVDYQTGSSLDIEGDAYVIVVSYNEKPTEDLLFRYTRELLIQINTLLNQEAKQKSVELPKDGFGQINIDEMKRLIREAITKAYP